MSEASHTEPRSALSRLRDLLDPLRGLTADDRDVALREVERRNLRVLRALLPIAVVLHLVGFWTGTATEGLAPTEAVRAWMRALWQLHVVSLLGVALLLPLAFSSDAPRLQVVRRARPYAGALFVAMYAVVGALVSGNAQRARPNIDVYTLTLLLSSALLLTPARVALPSAAIGAALLTTAAVHFQSDLAFLRSTLVNILSITVGGVIVGRLAYSSAVREIVDRRTIERQKRELVSLNEGLEAKVADKVGEILQQAEQLAQLNAQLQERVRERSRELSIALARLARDRGGVHGIQPGQVLAERVRIVSRLGEGGMGAVYEAVDLRTDQRVAVKVMQASSVQQLDTLHRFLREVRAAASVDHPAVARTMHLDVSDDGMLFQVQELVAGAPLAAVLRDVPLPPREVARVGAVLASALEAAHAAGVVHRDVKPSNVMLTHLEPGLKVLDFGISKLARDVQDAREEKLTASSHLVGTPEYMSPEQVLTPESITERSDVYMLGLVLFRMLAGRGPFAATGASQFLVAHAYDAPAELAALVPTVPATFTGIVMRCLAKQPALRPSAAEVREALEREADGAPRAAEVARVWMAERERSDVTLRAAITRSAR